MKRNYSRLVNAIVLFVLLYATVSYAHQSAFDRDAAPWHKKAIITCGMLKNLQTFDQQQMLHNLQELKTELEELSSKYLSNPPHEYANDPLWKTYFEDLADNIAIVQERVEKKQYRLAQKYCGNFCMIFGKMHRTNGTTDLTDVMFAWRMEIRNAMDMVNAGNMGGAQRHLLAVKSLAAQVREHAAKHQDPAFAGQLETLFTAATQWSEGIENADRKAANEQFAKFMTEFPRIYLATLSGND